MDPITYEQVVQILKDFSTFFTALFAGIGAVIGLFITNIWQDNRQKRQIEAENYRKEREREMSLRKDIYFEYMELIGQQARSITSFTEVNSKKLEDIDSTTSNLKHINWRLHLIAFEPLLNAANAAMEVYRSQINELQTRRLHYDLCLEVQKSLICQINELSENIEKSIKNSTKEDDKSQLPMQIKRHKDLRNKLDAVQKQLQIKYVSLANYCESAHQELSLSLKETIKHMRLEFGSPLSNAYFENAFKFDIIDHTANVEDHVLDLQKFAVDLYSEPSVTPNPSRGQC